MKCNSWSDFTFKISGLKSSSPRKAPQHFGGGSKAAPSPFWRSSHVHCACKSHAVPQRSLHFMGSSLLPFTETGCKETGNPQGHKVDLWARAPYSFLSRSPPNSPKIHQKSSLWSPFTVENRPMNQNSLHLSFNLWSKLRELGLPTFHLAMGFSNSEFRGSEPPIQSNH